MDKVVEVVSKDWYALLEFSPRILAAAIVLLLFYLLGKYVANLMVVVLRRASIKRIHESFFRAVMIAIATFFGLIIAFNILGLEKIAVSMLAGGGVTAVVLGFAFREIGENFLAGIFLSFSRPFKIGDLINTEAIEGYVKEIELRYTHLRTEDGRDVYVPSSQLFGRPLTNYTKDGLRRIGFTLGIDYSNDASRACEVLSDTVSTVTDVLKEPRPRAYVHSLSPQYVELGVYFWIDVFDRSVDMLSVKTEVLDKCRKALLAGKYIVSSEMTLNIAIMGDCSDVD